MSEEFFGNLWSAAEAAIRKAEAVFFIGYRFPESDATARGRVLSALAHNETVGCLRIFTALGPDRQSPESVRLLSLIRHSVGLRRRVIEDMRPEGTVDTTDTLTGHIEALPFWAEDLLDLYGRAMLGSARW